MKRTPEGSDHSEPQHLHADRQSRHKVVWRFHDCNSAGRHWWWAPCMNWVRFWQHQNIASRTTCSFQYRCPCPGMYRNGILHPAKMISEWKPCVTIWFYAQACQYDSQGSLPAWAVISDPLSTYYGPEDFSLVKFLCCTGPDICLQLYPQAVWRDSCSRIVTQMAQHLRKKMLFLEADCVSKTSCFYESHCQDFSLAPSNISQNWVQPSTHWDCRSILKARLQPPPRFNFDSETQIQIRVQSSLIYELRQT